MLPAAHRLRRPEDFSRVLRGRSTGQRTAHAGGALLVVHRRPTDGPDRAGFVVSKAVGNAVVRNRVKRVLRHLVAARIAGAAGDAPVGDLVVWAQPAAAQASTAALAQELDRLLARCAHKLQADR